MLDDPFAELDQPWYIVCNRCSPRVADADFYGSFLATECEHEPHQGSAVDRAPSTMTTSYMCRNAIQSLSREELDI
jgi:hypothetical protein